MSGPAVDDLPECKLLRLVTPSGGGFHMSLILAATDRSELAQTLGTELIHFGHQIQLVRTGRRLLDDLDTDSFDIAVIDLLLPDIDGYEIARQIRLRSSMPTMMLVDTYEDIAEVGSAAWRARGCQ